MVLDAILNPHESTDMKRNLPFASLVAAIALGYSGVARADDITIDPTPFVSTASRADVRAELEAYRKSGVNPWARSYNPLRHFRSERTRAEVTAEYIAERKAVAALNGEDSGSQYLARTRRAGSAPVYLGGREVPKAQQ